MNPLIFQYLVHPDFLFLLDNVTDGGNFTLFELMESIWTVRNALTERHGSVRGYLEACGVPARDLDVILRWMVE